MKKTVALIIALCLVVLACVPFVPVRAASAFDNRYLIVESVSGVSDDLTINNLQLKIVRQNESKMLSDLTYFSRYETPLNSFVSNYDRYLIGYAGQGQNTQPLTSDFIVFGMPSDVVCVYYYTSINSSSWIGNYCFVSDHSFSVAYNRFGQNYDFSSQNQNSLTATLNNEYYIAWVGAANMISSTVGGDCPVYSFGQYADPFGQKLKTVWDNRDSEYNYNSLSFPYMDSQGNTVTPAGPDPEVNTALAFDHFDSQVVYNQMNKTFTSANLKWDLNPMGRSILETYPAAEWDLKFTCQVTYNMSSYRPNNQTTPLQSFANGFTFTGSVGFEDYDSIMDGQIYGIDPIKGFETLSDTEIASAVNPDCNLFLALLGAMKGNFASGNDNTSGKTGFSLLGGTIVNNWTQFATSVGGFGAAMVHFQEATGVNGHDWLQDHISGDYVYRIDNFTMNVRAWFECGSVKSNYGDTDIDYLNHTTSSYAPRAYETQEGVDPTIPEPYTNTNDTPVEPGGLDANGVIVYVPVNVEVNVPSGGGGGDNTVNSGDNSIINNNNPTFNPVFNNNNENSVESLSDLIGEDAATANNGIGGFLDPFKNNSMVTLTGEYFGIVPEGLRTVLTAAVGILIILGIYRFIRRG